MFRTWQDFDPNCRETWGRWFGTASYDGHVYLITGPHLTREACLAALGA